MRVGYRAGKACDERGAAMGTAQLAGKRICFVTAVRIYYTTPSNVSHSLAFLLMALGEWR